MAERMKVYELAKNLGVKSIFLMDKIRKEWKLPVKSHMESLSPELVKKIEEKFLVDSTKKKKSSVSVKRKVVKKVAAKKEAKSSSVKKSVKSSAATKSVKSSAAKKVTIRKVVKKEVEASPEPTPSPKKETKNIIRRRKQDQVPIQAIDMTPQPEKKSPQQESSSLSPKQREFSKTGIRSDLVSVKNTDPLAEDSQWGAENKDKDLKKPVKKATTEKEVQIKFQAADFRKREVIFQPKKKRNLITGGDLKKTKVTTPKVHKRVVKVHGEMKIDSLAKKINVKKRELIKKLKSAGVIIEDSPVLDFETIALVVPDFGFEAKNTRQTEQDILKNLNSSTDDKKYPESVKPPVVTIMGHVDHGKTTLLDTIRKTKVAKGEAGGITQHIGAYSVITNGKPITFIDTPGHEAFTAMRARGAQATDIVVIVVAATDGVMPQTIEAINHAQTAKTPLIVAVNKMDAPGAQVDQIKQQMAKHEIVPEDWGGEVSFIPISALKGEGIDTLLEQIQTLADMQELKCQIDRMAKGVVIESHLEKGRGSVVTLLVQNGTLKPGNIIVAGESSGRVRQIKNDQGQIVKEVKAGFPAEVIGFGKLPLAGDPFDVVENEKGVKELTEIRKGIKQHSAQAPVLSVEEMLLKAHSVDDQEKQELPIVIKLDVAGSLEALKSSLDKLSTENIAVKVVHSGVGGITESDVLLASTIGGVILGFNVRPDSKASQISRDKSVTIKTYSIIYELLDDVKKMMLGKLKSEVVEEEKGKAEIREIFHISKLGTVAGCYVTSGVIPRNGFVRLVRDSRLIHEGKMASLKHFKEDVKEVKNGFECGISLEKFNDLKPKDVLEVYIKKEIERTEL